MLFPEYPAVENREAVGYGNEVAKTICDIFTGLSYTPQGSGTLCYVSPNHQNSAYSLTCGKSLQMIHEKMNE